MHVNGNNNTLISKYIVVESSFIFSFSCFPNDFFGNKIVMKLVYSYAAPPFSKPAVFQTKLFHEYEIQVKFYSVLERKICPRTVRVLSPNLLLEQFVFSFKLKRK